MSENITLSGEFRTTFGKGAARALRRAGKTPAVIYGHGSEPKHVALPSHELSLIVRRANAVIELDIEGTEEMVLVKDVQRDPVSSVIEHVDLVIVLKGEKVEVEVPLHLEGEALAPAVANLDVTHLLVKVPATDIPEHFVINVEGLEEGNHITAANVSLPDDVELITEPETVVVTVAVPALEEEPEAETATEEAPAEDAPAAEE
ncbi:MAG TPA: 50S ribosomal protein L25/general stress protein Ctc [Pseudoclavibacter sp.]|nr:50S ribosomal protein L25/general stress protein Ctc [Pseudoclavibacter sp.]